ncbi:MAG: lysophospholipid acyltransferase family protein [Draconibacterium sp.]
MKIFRIILFSPLALIRLLLVLLSTLIFSTTALVWMKSAGFSRKVQKWTMGNWGKSLTWICGIRLDKRAFPHDSNFIMMSNHRSYLDIFVVAGLTPSAMVGKAEIAKWPLGKLAMKVSNSILVDRNNTSSLIHTMKKIKESVSQGIPVTLFPEGTTYKGPLTKNFKNGSFKIASETGIPVIPMAIQYQDKEDAWVGDDTFLGHFFRQMGKPVTRVSIRYGTPLVISDYKELQTKTKESIDHMLNEM